MELNVKEQIEQKNKEAQVIGQQLSQIQEQMNMLTQRKQELINESFKNQGALNFLNSLNGKQPAEKRK